MRRPRVCFDVTFGVCWACLATLGPVWVSLLEVVVGFCMILSKKCRSADSMPLSSRSAIFAGSGVQVGATRLKRYAVEPLWRLLGALATVEFEVLCRSYGNHRNPPKIIPELDQGGGQSLSMVQDT